MSHSDKGWQSHYGLADGGQQYRCIMCGAGGASGRGTPKPLTYNCHECEGQATMWPTPQYSLYRAMELHLIEAAKAATEPTLMQRYLVYWAKEPRPFMTFNCPSVACQMPIKTRRPDKDSEEMWDSLADCPHCGQLYHYVINHKQINARLARRAV